MTRKLSVVLAFGAALATGTAAAHGVRYQTARVVGVQPVYRHVVVERPVTTCHTEFAERYVTRTRPNVGGQTLAGAIVGAAIGRQFGEGRGRDALTVLGAVAGSAVANDRARKRRGDTRQTVVVAEPVERCSTTYRRQTERQLTGYRVDYRHRGRIHSVRMNERPGRFIRIAVR